MAGITEKMYGNQGGGSGDSHNKGHFATPEDLRTAFPTAEAGDYATVESTDTIWLWDSGTSAWVDGHKTDAVTSVNNKTGAVVLNASDVGALENPLEDAALTVKNAIYGPFDYVDQIKLYAKYGGSDGTPAIIRSTKNGSLSVSGNLVAGGAIWPESDDNNLGAILTKWGTVYCHRLHNGGEITVPGIAGKMAVQVATLPTADSSLVGQMYQYVGTTDSTYTHGHLYECVSDGADPATYSWTEVSMGGGSGGSSTSATATLAVADWSGNSQTVNVTGVTASNNVIVAPAPASQTDYTNAGVKCTAQGARTLTFTCDTTPTSALTVNVLII